MVSIQDFKKVNVYKIKPNTYLEDLLEYPANVYHLVDQKNFKIYIKFDNVIDKEQTEKDIPWFNFLNNNIGSSFFKYVLQTCFLRAIVVLQFKLKEKDCIFVIPFGSTSLSLIDKDLIVPDFGIKVGMNVCDIEKLRRAQTTAYELITKQTDTKFLKALTGSVKEEYQNFIQSFTNKDSISLKLKKEKITNWNELFEVVVRLERLYISDSYKETEFYIYDLIELEENKDIIVQLDKLLIENIGTEDFFNIYLDLPKSKYGIDNEYFYREKKDTEEINVYNDLNIHDFFADGNRKRQGISVDNLKQWSVYKYDRENDTTSFLCNIYQCIIAEIILGGIVYILSNSNWFKVSSTLTEEVDDYLLKKKLLCEQTVLPEDISIKTSRKGKTEYREDIYNEYAAKNSSELFSFDKAKISIGGQKSYEVCDLFSASKELIHVKKYNGSQSINSVCGQVDFYAPAFSTEKDCRKDMKAHIIKTSKDSSSVNYGKTESKFTSIIPDNNSDVDERQYLIVICILHKSDNLAISDLSPMSRHKLMTIHKNLTKDRKFKFCVIFRHIKK